MSKPKAKAKRSNNFVPQLLLALATQPRFECKFSDLPSSYQDQPYNLANKIGERGGIKVVVVFNKEHDTFVVLRQANCNLTK